MSAMTCQEDEFRALFEKHGARETARILGITERAVYKRRKDLQEKGGPEMVAPTSPRDLYPSIYPRRFPLTISNGVVLVGGDPHYWPGVVTTAHRAFVHFAKELNVAATILNGDCFDGPKGGKHPPIGWAKVPNEKQILEAVGERLEEIRQASKRAEHVWNLGNHDLRFDSRFAAKTPEVEGVPGTRLQDHFLEWRLCISSWINSEVVVKHRFKGGIHATHNNTLWSGVTIVTNHLHSLKVTPFDDYRGTRYGVDTGTLADPYDPQFDYGEDNPVNHRSGFSVLTFHEGRLLMPELCKVVAPGKVEFRGRVIAI